MSAPRPDQPDARIAVIGMSARLPGAADLRAFWRLIDAGESGLRRVDADDLKAAGADPAELEAADYAPFWGGPPDADGFDAALFGYAPREAELLDPQQRMFLECACAALEDAGHDPARDDRTVGVYAGASLSDHLTRAAGRADPFEVGLASIGGMVAARVAYHLGLTGPSIGVQSTCSSSLTALHMAIQALRARDCDLALAGAVALRQPRPEGYRWSKEGIAAPDGQCRPFDAAAAGTVFTNGVGVVMLKRLPDALRDGDAIHGVLTGSALSNDGARKVGMTAPGVAGQHDALARALASAGLDGGDIDYVEAHGTGTAMGDPIELTALNRSYGAGLARAGRRCALGSVKGNVGHLDAAAGMAGLFKVLLSLRHARIPASGGFSTPNPRCAFGAFDVVAQPRDWPRDPARPRRAGLSSFGIGGGNAHLIVEEPPEAEPSPAASPAAHRAQLLPLSAHSEDALEVLRADMAQALEAPDAPALADIAFTLQTGRMARPYRQVVIAAERETAPQALRAPAAAPDVAPSASPDLVYLFPGQGAQRAGMAGPLHRGEPVFRAALEQCLELAPEALALRSLLLAPQPGEAERIHRTQVAQPALFALEYALGRLWLSRGVTPVAMIGHSVGEFAAACLADMIELPDAVRLVCARGAAMQACAPGAMLSAMLSEAEAKNALPDGVELAAINGPRAVTLAGPVEAIDALAAQLDRSGVGCRRLQTSHAFHSTSMDAAIAPFRAALEGVRLSAPRIPIISTLTGEWMTPEESCDPDYWIRQMRAPVRFSDAAARMMELDAPLSLEVGPGAVLTRLVRQQGGDRARGVASLPDGDDDEGALEAMGALWRAGVAPDWRALHDGRGRKASLPAHPFLRDSFWLPPHGPGSRRKPSAQPEDWCWRQLWRQQSSPAAIETPTRALDEEAAAALGGAARGDILLTRAAAFAATERGYGLDPADADQQRALLDALAERGVRDLICGWGLGEAPPLLREAALAIGRAAAARPQTLRLTLIGAGLLDATGAEALAPRQAATLGLAAALPQDAPGLGCRVLDLDPAAPHRAVRGLAEALATPFVAGDALALRSGRLWRRVHEPAQLRPATPLAAGEICLIAGDLADGLGPIYARALRENASARLILIGRGLPPVEDWEGWLATHGPADPASRMIAMLRSTCELGRDLVVFSGDDGDPDWLESALRAGETQLGAVAGIFHVSAMGDTAHRALADTDPATLQRAVESKLRGIDALRAALRRRAARFCLVQSSLSVLAGGQGFAAYAAANAALEAAVALADRDGETRWRSVAWDAAETGSLGAAGGERSALRLLRGEEVWRVSQAAIAAGDPAPLVVTPGDLQDRLSAAAQPPSPAAAKPARRPTSKPFIAPRDAHEAAVAAVMAEMLGLPEVSVEDDFFELGGQSLLALQIVNRLRARFEVELPVRALLYEAPTAAAIAAAIRKAEAARDREADLLGDLLDEIEDEATA